MISSCVDRKLIYPPEVATDALRDILIHLQGTLLKHLCAAQEDDNITDFNVLVDASDFGRVQSVLVLNGLYMRMAQSAPLRHVAFPAPGQIDTLESTPSFDTLWENNERAPQKAPLQPLFQLATPSRPIQSPRERGSPPDNKDLGVSHTPRKKWVMFPASRSHTESVDMSPQAPNSRSKTDGSKLGVIEDEPGLRNSPLDIDFGEQKPPTFPQMITGPSSTSQRMTTADLSGAATWKTSPEMVIVEANPWVSEFPMSTISTDVPRNELLTGLNTPQRGVLTPLVEGVSPQPVSNRPQRKMPFMPRWRTSLETAHVTEESSKTPKGLPMISRMKSSPQTPSKLATKDPCGGFCMGAYKLQMGLDEESVELMNQSVSPTGQSYYWKCANSECVFETPALKTRKTWTFDDKVHSFNGVQFRWTFLTKSHVAMRRAKGRKYDYQCVFCVRSDQERTIYRSENAFIEHVSTHRGEYPMACARVICINGVASEEEDFDINLRPLDETLPIHNEVFVGSPDLLIDSPALVT